MTHLSTTFVPSGGRNVVLKLFGIGVLTLATIVPLFLLSSLVDERRQYADQARADIAAAWGEDQTVAGPFLVVPYAVPGTDGAPPTRGQLVISPKALEAKAAPTVEERRRGIFRVPVFTTDIDLAGTFSRTAAGAANGAVLDWTHAQLALGVSDVRGIAGDIALTWAGQPGAAFEPGSSLKAQSSGAHAAVAMGDTETPFHIVFRLHGSGRLAFVPAASTFSANVTSPWPSPSFDGVYLPESRDVTDSGFNATWQVSQLARMIPQTWENATPDGPQMATLGVTFYQPVDFYQLVARSLKYAILFVGLSFLVIFLTETVTKARVHVVQYLMVGAAQVVFYLLLLALAEQVGFGIAYGVAAAACVILSALYALSALGTRNRAMIVAAALTVLYGLLYTLLNEEDYALLTGAVASFIALALTMFLTRKVDWYETQAAVSSAIKD